jgi:hypothetical protein
MEEIVLNNVIDESAHRGDVRTGPQAHEKIGPRGRPGEARIHDDEFGPLVHGLGDPAKTDGVAFFVVDGRAADGGQRFRAVNRRAVRGFGVVISESISISIHRHFEGGRYEACY